MSFLQLIEAKRDGATLSDEQINSIVKGVTTDTLPEYQIAAFLMAVYFKGLNAAETRALTLSMRDSGIVLQFPPNPSRPVVDKHSTGGVGDKVSLPLAPLLAALGFRVPMISGRGLGITGGTLDKLESIPGFSTALPVDKIVDVVERVGCAMIRQTEDMVPADKRLYAMRDVTATVPSINLITASVLSKKLSEGLDALVLDVKYGEAAFMKTREDAQKLAEGMETLGNACGVKVEAFLNDMDTPLGRTAGNWLEVVESVECLENRGPDDLRELVLQCAGRLLVLTGRESNLAAGLAKASACLESGVPRAKWNELLEAQGGDLNAFTEKLKSPIQAFSLPIVASKSGTISACNARIIGEVVRDLGGGRAAKDSILDLNVGIADMKKPGEQVEQGEKLCVLYARNEIEATANAERTCSAWIID
ncbi:pyrimidine-nucleoside phosphorylase [Karstenula rhodostoma CBS 690.94]|uniref:Thymidine phosphorylase n=1 Tax=Karstenula rhodostoma CBS 690.94 TaxID=1392251 RepID=A0A9P4P679_9PLEO|nr:pyrimidine-nucleoside phosphorylase [Karstenula rhodostoma CBS 690.94]